MAKIEYIPAPRVPPAESDEKFRSMRAEVENLKRIEREVKLAQQRGELITREMAQRQASFVMTSLRSRLLALPASLARKLDVSDRHSAKLLIDKEIRQALEELASLTERICDDEWTRRPS